jgi:hypothetical protein
MLVRTNIYLPKPTVDKLKRRAKEQGTTMSEIIRKSLEKDEITYAQNNGIEGLLKIAEKSLQYTARERNNEHPNKLDHELYSQNYERERDEFMREFKKKHKNK